MKLYQKIIVVIIVSIISIFGGLFNWINAFIIVGVLFFVSTFFLIDNKIKKWLTILFLLSPFLLINGGYTMYEVIFYNYSFPNVYPTLIISIVSTFLGLGFKLLYLKYKKKKIIVFALIYLLFFIVGGYFFIYNYFHLIDNEPTITQTEKISDIKIWDFSGNEIKLEEMENKVVVLDFWSVYCGYCFRKFPDFEKVKNYYNGKDVVFYAVYIQWNREETENAELESSLKWIEEQNFTFNVVKTDTATANKLGVRAVPHLLIYDKNKKLSYNNGFFNQDKRFLINNLYSVIDKLLEE